MDIIDNYTPELTPNQEVICELSPASFDAIVKTLSILDDSNIIYIQKSEICQPIKNGVAILNTNISTLINNQQIDLTILNPKKYIKLFKSIKGNSNVFIINDNEYKKLIVCNEGMKVFLPKQIEETMIDVTLPDLSECEMIGEPIEIDKVMRNTIVSASLDQNINMIIHSNQFKGVYIPETAIVLFDKYAKENISEVNNDILLESLSFLSIPAEKYTIYIGKCKENKYWSIVECNVGLPSIIYVYESLHVYSDELLI